MRGRILYSTVGDSAVRAKTAPPRAVKGIMSLPVGDMTWAHVEWDPEVEDLEVLQLGEIPFTWIQHLFPYVPEHLQRPRYGTIITKKLAEGS